MPNTFTGWSALPLFKLPIVTFLVLKMPSSTPRILYIEDHADTRELVSVVLRLANYNVMIAESPDKALALARTMSFDLYILDNWMPGISGIELCKQLRSFDLSTPILFYSGAAYERDKREAIDAGAQGYLTKPVDNDALVQQVSRLISEARRANTAEISILSSGAAA